MATKQFEVENIGFVTVNKSRRSKHLRLTIKHDGTITVSAPSWVPYKIALDYVKAKESWIIKNHQSKKILYNNAKIGKAHRLVLTPRNNQRFRTSIKENIIKVNYPDDHSIESPEVQKAANKACIKALTLQANELLPIRLNNLAESNGFVYKTVKIRTLKSRWGSCSSKADITLSCYLMQLSWKEIDYVLLHELTHTVHMSHGAQFWRLLISKMPDAKDVRKLLAAQKPQVTALD